MTAWSPLGYGRTANPPYGDPGSVAGDFVNLGLNQRYCVRVRARSDRDLSNNEVYGEYTELGSQDGTGWAFQWVGYPAGGACTPSCNAGYLGSGDYVLPAAGNTVTQTPLITWRPLAGRASYFVIVAKDPSFTNLVDYAFTQIPAYAPRTALSDHVPGRDDALLLGGLARGAGERERSRRQSAARSALVVRQAVDQAEPARAPERVDSSRSAHIRWTLALGARRYRLQVAQDPSFGNPIDDILTDATSHTSNTTYPADTALYGGSALTTRTSSASPGRRPGRSACRLPAPVRERGQPRLGRRASRSGRGHR